MERAYISRIPDEMNFKANSAEEIDVWATALHDMGFQCRPGIGERETMKIRRNGYEFLLVAGDPDRRNNRSDEYPKGIPMPNFMGYEGFALRSITKIN